MEVIVPPDPVPVKVTVDVPGVTERVPVPFTRVHGPAFEILDVLRLSVCVPALGPTKTPPAPIVIVEFPALNVTPPPEPVKYSDAALIALSCVLKVQVTAGYPREIPDVEVSAPARLNVTPEAEGIILTIVEP